MIKHGRSFWRVAGRIGLGVILIAVIGFVVFALKMGVANDIRAEIALPNCSSTRPFSRLPVNLSDISEVVPLGNVNPDGHTYPSDHTYLYWRPGLKSSNVVSPGKVIVTRVTYHDQIYNNKAIDPGDYDIHFDSCRGREFYFNHLSTLDGKLAVLAKQVRTSNCSHQNVASGIRTVYCDKGVYVKLSAGESMGILGPHGMVQAIDFGATQRGSKSPSAVNSRMNGANAVCPFDYFDKPSQARIYAKVRRQTAPRCGQVYQDLPGTVQGIWSTDPIGGDWNSQLSIVHYNVNPRYGVIGIGGGPLGQPSALAFVPRNSGSINLEPNKTVKNTMYCYQNERSLNVPIAQPTGEKHLTVQLTGDRQMKVEVGSGNCPAHPRFNSSTTYYR